MPLIVLATMFAMVAMILATMAGLDRVPRVLLKTARIHRLSLIEEIWQIRLPAAAPHILSGLKLAVAYSFIGVIAGEFILSTSGIGHEIAFAYDNFDNPRMYALILFVLCIVTAVQHAGLRLGASHAAPARRMSGGMLTLRAWRDPILVAISLVALWQVLHQMAGDSAVTAPLPDARPICGR